MVAVDKLVLERSGQVPAHQDRADARCDHEEQERQEKMFQKKRQMRATLEF